MTGAQGVNGIGAPLPMPTSSPRVESTTAVPAAAAGTGANQCALLAADERTDRGAAGRGNADLHRVFLFRRSPVRATRPVSTLYRSPLPRGTSVVNRMAMYERPFTLPGRRTAVTLP